MVSYKEVATGNSHRKGCRWVGSIKRGTNRCNVRVSGNVALAHVMSVGRSMYLMRVIGATC